MSSSVSEVISSTNGGREFCSCVVLNRTASTERDDFLGVSPVSDSGYTGVVEGIDVAYDGFVGDVGYGVRFYLKVVNQENPSLVYQTLEYFYVRLFGSERPVFFRFKEPLNFVCPPGYFLCCHYHAQADYAVFLSTANIRWKSCNVA